MLRHGDPHSSLLLESARAGNSQVSPARVFVEGRLQLRVVIPLDADQIVGLVFAVNVFRCLVRISKFLLGFFKIVLVPSSEVFPPRVSVSHPVFFSLDSAAVVNVNKRLTGKSCVSSTTTKSSKTILWFLMLYPYPHI